jgi:hypothetical protein
MIRVSLDKHRKDGYRVSLTELDTNGLISVPACEAVADSHTL